MIKISEHPQFVKLHRKQPERIMLIFSLLLKTTGGGLLTIAKVNEHFMNTKYEKYVFVSIAKWQLLMPKDNFFAFTEMVKSNVGMEVLSNYMFNNLFIGANN